MKLYKLKRPLYIGLTSGVHLKRMEAIRHELLPELVKKVKRQKVNIYTYEELKDEEIDGVEENFKYYVQLSNGNYIMITNEIDEKLFKPIKEKK